MVKVIGVRLCDCIKIFEEADVRSKKLWQTSHAQETAESCNKPKAPTLSCSAAVETQSEGTFIKEKTTCSFNLYIKSTKPHEVRPNLPLLGHLPVQAQ